MTVSIITMTWARDASEEKLLRASLAALAKLELPTFITDGGSPADFIEFVRSFPNFTLLQSTVKGLWPQVKTSISAALESGSEFLIYTEPDKMEFFKTGLPVLLQKVDLADTTGVLIAARSAAGFESYPAFQRMCETTINNCCSEGSGVTTDFTYGPFIMNRHIATHLGWALKNEAGWGWRTYTFVIAKRLGFEIISFEGEYFCPVDQRDENAAERVYRMRQLGESVEAVVLACNEKL